MVQSDFDKSWWRRSGDVGTAGLAGVDALKAYGSPFVV